MLDHTTNFDIIIIFVRTTAVRDALFGWLDFDGDAVTSSSSSWADCHFIIVAIIGIIDVLDVIVAVLREVNNHIRTCCL
jgi:hypothetical protein